VTLDVEIADSTRLGLSVSDSAFQLLVERALQRLVANRIDRHGPPATEQIRSWSQPIVLDRERFPDNL